ncbi:MAG: protein phosphatase 2C domain-containing protein [Lachnospiraceae bacterium]|nr:protein phosphatase 2C domain-containing protein [Lachnospiraceae bacterium]
MSDANIIKKTDKKASGEIQASVHSIIGHREYQQDYAGLLVSNSRALAVVCDGMGGLNGGERASQEAVKLLIDDYEREKPAEDFSGFLVREASRMDQLVFEMKSEDGDPLKAGSTVVAVIVEDGKLYWMSVGDSHIYVLRGDTMVPVTRDHNYRRDLEDALSCGGISKEKYEREIHTRRAEALTSYLGIGGLRKIEKNAKAFFLEDGDEVLLCSDGVYKSLDEHQIKAMLIDNRISVSVAVRRLVEMALMQAVKSQDNTTAILLRYNKLQTEDEHDALL